MRGGVGLDTQGERSISLPECLGTGPDRSPARKQDSCEPQGPPSVFRSLNTVTSEHRRFWQTSLCYASEHRRVVWNRRSTPSSAT